MRPRSASARYLPEPEAGLLVGILLGDESGISEEVYEDFSQVGAAHIIAISGFNMTLLAGILSVFLERMGIGRWRLLWVLSLWIVLYTLLVGASPSVMRAAVMSLFLVLGYALERRVLLLTSLAAGAWILTIGESHFALGYRLPIERRWCVGELAFSLARSVGGRCYPCPMRVRMSQ